MTSTPSGIIRAARAPTFRQSTDHAIHTRTGHRCTVLIYGADLCFCNFGALAEPFTWVQTSELTMLTKEECRHAA
jgi:hypothetical protein